MMHELAIPAAPVLVSSAWRDRLRLFRATHRQRAFAAQGRQWNYLSGGSGSRVALLLHGSESDAESLFGVMSLLERHMTVVAPTIPDTVSSLDEASAGLAALLEAHTDAPALVVGYSLGGYLAQALAERRPDRVGRLALCNTGGPTPTAIPMVRAQYALFAALPDLLLHGAFRAGAGLPLWRESPGLAPADYHFWRDYVAGMAARLNKRTILAHGHLTAEFLLRHASPPATLASGVGHVLILDAMHDHVIEAKERVALRASYPLATVRMLPTTGHLSVLTHPEVFVAAIDEAFAGWRWMGTAGGANESDVKDSDQDGYQSLSDPSW